MTDQTPIPARLPVRVPLVTEPLGLFGSLRLARRNVLAILPDLATRQPMVSGRTGARSWCLTPLAVRTPRLPHLRQMFAELAPTERQAGLDDELRGWYVS